jgi:hypothetical protein
MPIRPPSFLLALAAAGFAAHVLAAVSPPVAVQPRRLVLPELPAGADVPMNLPEDGAVKLPFVTGGAPGVASRINAAVWREMLDGAIAPTTPGKTWTPPRDKLPQGTSSLAYTVDLLPAASPRLLSLSFSAEGCGAYCEESTSTRLFDLRDGRELSLGDLLTLDGFAALGRRLDAERRRAYRAQVRELRATLKSARKGQKNDDDDTADRLALNETCLQQADSQPSTPRYLVSDVLSLDGHGGLRLARGRCSNHANRALDDVDEVKIAVPPADLKPWLTPYGLAVVRQEGDAPAPPATFAGRELHGRLAGLAVTMKLEPPRDGADTRGTYEYDKFHVPIPLTVRKEGDTLRAFEQGGEFELEPAGGSLVGTWRDKDHRRDLPVILQ